MSEKPILFSGEMVRAILSGAKTQTRRVIKPQPAAGVRHSPFVTSGLEDGHGREVKPRYHPGDLLWVRETWAKWDGGLAYRADCLTRDGKDEDGDIKRCRLDYGVKWRPSIFMPRALSRLSLRVTAVRCERLWEISETDAVAEGVELSHYYCEEPTAEKEGVHRCDPVGKFHALWNSINAKRGYWWASNPFVWAISFEVQP